MSSGYASVAETAERIRQHAAHPTRPCRHSGLSSYP